MKKLQSIVHFSSFLPKRCGIATYTMALIKSIESRFSGFKNEVVSIEDKPRGYHYSPIVKFHFHDKAKNDYPKAAEFINKGDYQVVDIQHEFGLYGSQVNPKTLGKDDGQNFLLFLNNLTKPSVTTLHMVYKNPPRHHVEVVRQIAQKTNHLVVLSEIAKNLLIKKYGLKPEKICVIPHGSPDVPKYSTPFFKETLGFPRDSIIISSFGLVRPKKGYEYLIKAMPEVIKKYPQARLLIAGKRHPQRDPEYPENLKKLVEKLNLKNNVKLINRFLDYPDLLNFLMATNIFVAPFVVMDQTSSGTLIYAMACGRVCVSTPFDFAKEALKNKRGILVPPRNSKAIANKIKYLIRHPLVRHRMEKAAYSYARKQTWGKTAGAYIKLFKEVVNKE